MANCMPSNLFVYSQFLRFSSNRLPHNSGSPHRVLPARSCRRWRCNPRPAGGDDRQEIVHHLARDFDPAFGVPGRQRNGAFDTPNHIGGFIADQYYVFERAHGLKPHRVRTFKRSRDPEFREKLEDIAGLYLNPPEHAIVLCADEKSQIQALDRTQPGLPMKKSRCGILTHDHKRNGTATLFASRCPSGSCDLDV